MAENDTITLDHTKTSYKVDENKNSSERSSLAYTSDDSPLHTQQPFEQLDQMIHQKSEKPVSVYDMTPAQLLEQLRRDEQEGLEQQSEIEKYKDLYDPDDDPHLLTLDEYNAKIHGKEKAKPEVQELTERKSEIIKDLGPQNEYDRTAMLAQISAKTYFDFELLRMGTHLSHLVQTIPYDSDKFYQVITLKRNIEKRIERLKVLETFKNETICVPENTDHGYAFTLYKLENNAYKIGIDLWSSAFLDDPGGLGDFVRRKVIDYLEKNFQYYKDERTYDRYAGARDEIDTYYDEKDRPVYYYRYHNHAAGGNYGTGYHNELTVYENPIHAIKIWENVKKIIEESIREHSATNDSL